MAESQYFITYRVRVKTTKTKDIATIKADVEERIRKSKQVVDVFPGEEKKVEGY